MDVNKDETAVDSVTKDVVDYVAPCLVVHGSVNDLTGGTTGGNFLDATFPVGSSRGDLTFS